MFNVCIHCEMITPVNPRNVSIISQLPFCVCVCVMRAFKSYSLGKFQVYNRILITLVTLPYGKSPDHIRPTRLKLCTPTSAHFLPSACAW